MATEDMAATLISIAVYTRNDVDDNIRFKQFLCPHVFFRVIKRADVLQQESLKTLSESQSSISTLAILSLWPRQVY